MGNTIFWGSSQEEEKIKQILNITGGKDWTKTPFIYIQFYCGAMRCYSESMLMLQVDQPHEEKVRERSLWSRFSAFIPEGKCLVCKDHDLKYIFLVCLERKYRWIKYDKTAIPYSTRKPLRNSTCKNVNVCKESLLLKKSITLWLSAYLKNKDPLQLLKLTESVS